LGWYDREARALPWRRRPDPWATWVSEVMLQQTRVEVVREAFPAFMARYPRPADFARATDDEVLLAWRGLGYYRRARLLRDGARAVLADHAGRVPDDVAALGRLPGIGEYTRGAIASIAFGRRVAAVDANVERVAARHRAIELPVKVRAGARAVRAVVEEWLDPARPGDFNQALMDLGATVCTPRSPACERCPIRADCRARAMGAQHRLPVLPPPRPAVAVTARCVLARARDGEVVGARVGPGAINAGQLDLPGPGPLVPVPNALALRRWLAGGFAGAFADVSTAPVARARHGITHHRIEMLAHGARVARARLPAPLEAASPTDRAVPWTTLARKVLAAAGRIDDAG
jgi:A/G-specific adenine glycosylase